LVHCHGFSKHLELFTEQERLHRRKERERARPAAETVGQKERRLKQRRERDRAKRAAQSVEQRHKSATERKRQAAETPDHREARLEEWRAAQQELGIGS